MIYKLLLKKIFFNRYLKKSGVTYGINCKFNSSIDFGSEPYLINIGDDFYCSSKIQFITHDGSINVIRNLYPEMKNADIIQPINIGNNVFLGYGTIILPGTTIGNNVIIGAGSIVKGVIESNFVYAGIPAKKIKTISEYMQAQHEKIIFTKHLSKNEKKKFLLNFKYSENKND